MMIYFLYLEISVICIVVPEKSIDILNSSNIFVNISLSKTFNGKIENIESK